MGELGRHVGVGGSYDLGPCIHREPLERKKGRCRCLPGREAADPRSLCTFTFPSSWSWQVPERGHPQSRCKLEFSFQDKPSFRNREIVKAYHFGIAGANWLRGQCGWVGEGVRCTTYLNLSCLPHPPSGYRACTSSPVHSFCEDGWELPASGRTPQRELPQLVVGLQLSMM